MHSPLRANHSKSFVLAFFTLAAVSAAACADRSSASGSGSSDRGGATSSTASTTANERVATPTDRTSAPTQAEPAPSVASGPPAEVLCITDDRIAIAATLRVGRSGSTPIVLVHQLASDRSEWEPLVAKLTEAGLTTLAIDLRGHGRSVGGDGATYRAFRDSDWRDTQKDVRAAINFLVRRATVQAEHVVLIGSSIGGTACLAAAAEDPRVSGIVVLSPGRAYHGFDAIVPASHLGERELLVLHSSEELPSHETAEVLDRIVAHSTVRAVPGSAHGVAMLAEDPTQLDAVVEFVRAAQPH